MLVNIWKCQKNISVFSYALQFLISILLQFWFEIDVVYGVSIATQKNNPEQIAIVGW
jgi:hypothetical protein